MVDRCKVYCFKMTEHVGLNFSVHACIGECVCMYLLYCRKSDIVIFDIIINGFSEVRRIGRSYLFLSLSRVGSFFLLCCFVLLVWFSFGSMAAHFSLEARFKSLHRIRDYSLRTGRKQLS
jgi:hypothetical protein